MVSFCSFLKYEKSKIYVTSGIYSRINAVDLNYDDFL